MSTKVSDKKFLELEGLKTLMDRLGVLREEYLTRLATVDAVNVEQTARLDALLKKETDLTEDLGLTEGKEIIVAVLDLIKEMRAELGTKPESVTKNIYTRLAELEEATTDLTNRVAALEMEAFTSVVTEYDRTANEIRVGFGTTKAEATAAAGSLVPNKSFIISTADFIIDGMLEKVESVMVSTQDPTGAWEGIPEGNPAYTLDEVPEDKRIDGHKYLVFTFIVNETDGVGNPVTPAKQTIWLDMNDLYKDYMFDYGSPDSEYVTLSLAETISSQDIHNIKYTVALTDKAKQDFSLVEGTYNLSDTETNRGILRTEADLKTVEDKVSRLEGEVRNGWINDDGDEEAALLDRVSTLEAWTHQSIPTADISNYFDYWILGDTEEAAAKRNEVAGEVKTDFTEPPTLE